MQSPVMIVGAPRSGTSMIMSIMKNYLGYIGHNEGHFFTLFYQLLRITEEHHNELKLTGANHSDFLILDPRINIEKDIKEIIKNNINKIYGEKPWFIKTPNAVAIRAIPLIREIYPTMKLIYMKRRGIENVLSQSRKFGAGKFKANYCTMWSDCLELLYTVKIPDETLIIDQLAFIIEPEEIIDRLLTYLHIEDTNYIKEKLKKYLETNPVENSADLSQHYIPLEDTPWNENEQTIFLEHCEATMRYGTYPISREEIQSFQPTKSFLFSIPQIKEILARNIKNPWNKIPATLSKSFHLHPNQINEDPILIFIKPSFRGISINFKMLDPHLMGNGISLKIVELHKDKSKSISIASFNLRKLDKMQTHFQSTFIEPIIKIELSNEKDSLNSNYKQLQMDVKPAKFI